MARTQSHITGYQQGDVLAKVIPALPAGAVVKPRTPRGLVLAEGEATGHAHTITEDGAILYEHEGTLYLVVEQPVRVEHEEHTVQTWAPGIYQIDRVRELAMLEGYVRKVMD